VHVEDIARAFVAIVEAPRELVHGEAFNVGRTQENYRVREVAQIVADLVLSASLRFAEGAGADARNYRVDCSKFERTFPKAGLRWDVRSGAAALLAALAEANLSPADFEGPRYQRIAHLRGLLESGRVGPDLRVAPALAAAS